MTHYADYLQGPYLSWLLTAAYLDCRTTFLSMSPRRSPAPMPQQPCSSRQSARALLMMHSNRVVRCADPLSFDEHVTMTKMVCSTLDRG